MAANLGDYVAEFLCYCVCDVFIEVLLDVPTDV